MSIDAIVDSAISRITASGFLSPESIYGAENRYRSEKNRNLTSASVSERNNNIPFYRRLRHDTFTRSQTNPEIEQRNKTISTRILCGLGGLLTCVLGLGCIRSAFK